MRNVMTAYHSTQHRERKRDVVGVRNMVEVTSVTIVSNVGIFPGDAKDHLQEEQKEGNQQVVCR